MKRDGCAGFALVEMLASLVILGMISVLILSGIGSGRRVWESLDLAAAGGEGVSSAQAVLRDRLEHVFPATRFDADAPYTDFTGETNTVEFLAPPVLSHAPDALRRFQLSLTPAGDLILASASDVAADPERPVLQTMVLAHGVRGLELSYFGVAAPDRTPRWRERWEMQAAPPQLVRVRIAFAPQDRRAWPDLVVHPAATIDAQCVLNAATGRCGARA